MVASVLSLPSTDLIAAALRKNSPVGSWTESRLAAVLDQTIGCPGKLVRPRLVYAAACRHGMDDDSALQLACAIEYFHLASLILDDLPCMDDAETRRGLTCVHREHGDSATILGALALINRGYGMVGFAMVSQPVPVRLAAMACLDACLGAAGLVGGQARDLVFAESDGSAREISRIAAGKTGSLFWLAIYFPALLAQPNAEEGRCLKALCLYWGLAFQAMDDMGDVGVGGTAAALGKLPGRDVSLNRPNLALALGVGATSRRIKRLLAQAERVINRLEKNRLDWNYLGNFHREYFEANLAKVTPFDAKVAMA